MSEASPPSQDPSPEERRARNPYAPDEQVPAIDPDGSGSHRERRDRGEDRRRDDTGDGPDRWMVRAGVTVAIALGLGILVAATLGFAGASGQVGAVVVLLLLSLGTAVGALMALVSAVVDEFRGRDVPWRRPVMGIVLFLAAAVLMAMTVAAAA